MTSPQFPTDYDQYAPIYSWARWAVPWVLEPLARVAGQLPPGATVLEAGCGTGNYVCALAALQPALAYFGCDLSHPMLAQAKGRQSPVHFVRADVTEAFPCRDHRCGLVFAVDVVHHLENLERFFQEARRVLAPGGRFVIVTDSESTMRQRSLTRFFPEILDLEQRRYPDPERLHAGAGAAGLTLAHEEPAVGDMPLSDAFVASLDAKCSSAMRLLPDEAHAVGMARVREAQAQGALWRSHYVALHYAVVPTAAARGQR
jgi:SAM-dependent methyltransferase